jgi:hypothetical protein
MFAVCGMKSSRCHDCNSRFATLGSSILFRNDLDRLLRKVSVLILAAVAVLAVVVAVLWLSRREANPSAAATRTPLLFRQASSGDRSS